MGKDKRNEFLDASDSEDEQSQGYNSEDDLRKGGRSTKRRRIDHSDDDEGSDLDGGVAIDDQPTTKDDEDNDEDEAATKLPSDQKAKKRKASELESEVPDIHRTLTKKNLVSTEAAVKKSGVIYMSRIPPFMKPAKLRSLLEPTPRRTPARVRAGGNKKRTYTEGWIEFVKKKDAKAVCELLNAQTIGGKKSSYYHDDLWNLKYLTGFKWHNLTEQISAENAERASRMRAEISKTTKENKEFVRNVEKAKMLDGMQTKAKKTKPAQAAIAEEEAQARGRTFKQIPLANKGKEGESQPEHVTRVLSKIF
uniref:18S rRNA factor 2 n=1 Tax=Bionectria ochroleuca TaxID=29856 RepID=A0A0B7JNY2_BIOOC